MTFPVEKEQPGPAAGPRRNKERTSHKGRTALIVMAALLLVAAIVSGGYIANLAHTFNSKTEKIQNAFPDESMRPQKTDAGGGHQAVNILLLGSDDRAGEVPVAGAPSGQRADTMMLIHIPADRKNLYSISLMRDLWLTIPGHGEDKLNAALLAGGIPLMVQTVESLFNQRIDHVATVNFEGFRGLTEALGGVEVNSSLAFTVNSFTYTAGPNTLSGEKALAFVRERSSFPDSDYQRVRNQQAFMKGLVAKISKAETLSNPITVNRLVNVITPFVAVDKTLDAAAIGSLVMELKDVRPQNLSTFTLPTLGVGTSGDGQSIVLTDPDAIQAISAALAADKLGDYVAANNLQNGN